MGAFVWALLLVTWFNLTFAFSSQIRHSNATPSVGERIKDIKSDDRVDNVGRGETGTDNTANDTSSSSSALWRHQRRNTRRLPTSSSSTMMSHVSMYSSNVGDEPQFSSSQNRHIYQHSSPLGLPQHLLAESTSHVGNSYGGQSHNSDNVQGQSQRKCQVMQKPMPTFDNYNGVQQKMMTCYVCGDQLGGYGGYTEDCQYKPTQDSTQNYAQTTTRHYNSVPYKASSNGPRQNNRGHEVSHSYEEVSPQATSDGKNTYNGGQSGGGVKCKIVQKGHMKCRVCGDSKSDAVFSEQCGFESNDPGQHGQRSYDFSTANENTYRSPYRGHTPDFGGTSNGYGRPSYSANFNSYSGPYDDHSSYAPSRNYQEETAHLSSSTGNKDVKVSPSEGRNKNCKIIYKHMDSHYNPYSKGSGDKPKMKCEVCVKSDGYGGVTEECNYSDGGESTGSYPGPFDLSSFYGPDQDHFYSGVHDDIYGDYFFK